MKLWAIGDLHLGFLMNKPMDRFGDIWKNHEEKIVQNWLNKVKAEDTVLLAGDLSWAVKLEDAQADLHLIDCLPGKKICILGNHDYWWSSTGRLNHLYPGMFFLKNDCACFEQTLICGTRGWLCPNDALFTPHDKKIYEREVGRLLLSLKKGIATGKKEIIVCMHFPPVNDKKEPSGFTALFKEFNVKKVIYGHLHGEESHKNAPLGLVDGVEYCLVSGDYLEFSPMLVLG